jgi:hypothetical protein
MRREAFPGFDPELKKLEGIKDRIDRAGGLPSGVGSLPPMRKRP